MNQFFGLKNEIQEKDSQQMTSNLNWLGAIKGMALWSRGFSRGSLIRLDHNQKPRMKSLTSGLYVSGDGTNVILNIPYFSTYKAHSEFFNLILLS